MSDLTREALRERFAAGDAHFTTSPLYRALARSVCRDDTLLDLAAHARPGQQPANMLMGAVQTNAPGRGVSVRLAMHEVARRVGGPVTFLEVGPSAGIQLRFDSWAVRTGGRRFGPADAPLTLTPQWRAGDPPPDLDVLPEITDRLGVDLHPVDATDPAERRWLQALVWPEHTDRLAELATALDAVAADPPEILAGDATALLPELDRSGRLGPDRALVVFHAMVRLHVAAERRPAFDAAITALNGCRRLLHISLEMPPRDHPLRGDGHLLTLRDSAGPDVELAIAEGHGRWIAPL